MYSEYSFVFDIDGTLCPIKKKDEKYEDLIPYKEINVPLLCSSKALFRTFHRK